MLKINNELGFKPSMTMKLWQVRLDKVREYIALAHRGAGFRLMAAWREVRLLLSYLR